MPPEKKDQTAGDMANSTLGDLHNEGIDIVPSSSIAEDNEFSGPSDAAPEMPVAPADFSAPDAVAAPVVAQPQPAAKPRPVMIDPIPTQLPAAAKPVMPTFAPMPVFNQPTPAPAATPQPAAKPSLQDAIFTKPADPLVDQVPGLHNDPSIKPLRTYKSDAEEAIQHDNISTVSMAVAEQKKKEASTPIQYESDKKSALPLIIALLALVLVAGGGAYYWFFMRTPSAVSSLPEGVNAQTIIPYTKADIVRISRETNPLDDIAAKLTVTPVQLGQVYALLLLPAGTTTLRASASDILAKTDMPARLDRSLAAEYMVGSYLYNGNGPFLILKDTFYQNAYAGMLEWEKSMRNDLISLVRVKHPAEMGTATDVDVFADQVISNVDARVLKNAAGETILVYAFADQNTLVIATDPDTIKYVLDKLLSVRVVQ